MYDKNRWKNNWGEKLSENLKNFNFKDKKFLWIILALIGVLLVAELFHATKHYKHKGNDCDKNKKEFSKNRGSQDGEKIGGGNMKNITNDKVSENNNNHELEQNSRMEKIQKISNSEIKELTEKERAGLIHMLEEERLAKDVYNKMYEKYKINIFSNIPQAEEKHISDVKSLVEKYNIEFELKK